MDKFVEQLKNIVEKEPKDDDDSLDDVKQINLEFFSNKSNYLNLLEKQVEIEETLIKIQES